MSNNFARIITLLRKENGLSQKKVALDLNISQALLSHYEKGIRECGLDFLLKIADYYGVSCDYLLGRTSEKNGAILSISSKNNNKQNHNKKDNKSENVLEVQLNKTIILNSISFIFDIISNEGNDSLSNSVTNYMINIVYKLFRMLYTSNNKNISDLFSVDKNLYNTLSNALEYIEIGLIDFNIKNILKNDKNKFVITRDKVEDIDGAASLYNLIKKAEEEIERLHNSINTSM